MGEISLSPTAAFEGAELFLGLAAALATAELLTLHHHYEDRGLLTWRILGSGRPTPGFPALRAIASALFGARGYTLLLAVRLLAGSGLVVLSLVSPTHSFWPLVAVAITSCLLIARSPLGRDGSDQMVLVASVALCLGHPVVASGTATDATLYFVGGQGILAYGTAGVAKLAGPLWRRGDAVGAILASHTFGPSSLGTRLQEHPALNRGATWATIGVECLVPVALFVSPAALVLALGVALVFHVFTAAAMGLNTFVPTFLITYAPAVYLSIEVQDLISP